MLYLIRVEFLMLLVERDFAAVTGLRRYVLREADIELILAGSSFLRESACDVDDDLAVIEVDFGVEVIELLSYGELNVLCDHRAKGFSFPIEIIDPTRKSFKVALGVES